MNEQIDKEKICEYRVNDQKRKNVCQYRRIGFTMSMQIILYRPI